MFSLNKQRQLQRLPLSLIEQKQILHLGPSNTKSHNIQFAQLRNKSWANVKNMRNQNKPWNKPSNKPWKKPHIDNISTTVIENKLPTTPHIDNLSTTVIENKLPTTRIYNLKMVRLHESKLKYVVHSPIVKIMIDPSLNIIKSPSIIDMRSKMPPVYNQGNLGSCTANALCGAYQYTKPKLYPSRLFVYYNERMIENDVSHDSGAYLSDGVISLVKYGVCSDADWPYNIRKFAIKPTPKCYRNALSNTVLTDQNVQPIITQIQQCLVNGLPIVIGFAVYQSFENNSVAMNGMVPMPDQVNEPMLGGHAVLVCGYNNSLQWYQNTVVKNPNGSTTIQQTTSPTNRGMWIVRNSWGKNWGVGGYFYLPYPYLTDLNLTTDLWTLNTIKGALAPLRSLEPTVPNTA